MQKHYDAITMEQKIQAFWEEEKLYAFDASRSLEKPLYAIDTPPPTVNGQLHIGHIFSYTQAEMIARYKRMQGFNVYYPFGFDDNGLPTERLVEKVLGIRAGDMPREDFITSCLETTQQYEAEFKALWQSLGFSCDWSLQYETISPLAQRISQRSFIDLYRKGKAYMKESPVLWCPECRTSIAQAELDTLEKDTTFYTLTFALFGSSETLAIATTRPELLSSCLAIFVHPEDSRAKALLGQMAIVPLYGQQVPILADETVDPDKGTGLVMCCSYGDATDVAWIDTHGLTPKHVITPSGFFTDDTPIIGGLSIAKARQAIISALHDGGHIIGEQPLSHRIGIHERCGKPTEFLSSKQWYIDILTDKTRYLSAADELNWYPESMKARYIHWAENLSWDWCISRQRYFGVPIPVWYCENCGKVHLPADEQLPVNPLSTAFIGRCDCGSEHFIPEAGVLDTWATSSLTPQINAHWGEPDDGSDTLIPMGMRTQAHEIIRTWAFYTIVKSLYHTGKLPWRDLMICGFVLAKKGEKISKSKDNASSSPQQLIQAHSADAIRYWAAGAKLGTDTFFDAEELTLSKKIINKLWNAAKFCYQQLGDEKLNMEMPLLPADAWLLERLQETTEKARKALDAYEIGLARHQIDAFFLSDFCDHYLELSKERLYQPEKHGYDAQASGRVALYKGLLGILKLYAPYMPHLTEVLYQAYFVAYEEAISIHLTEWPSSREVDETLLAFGEEIKEALTDARRYKSENKLSMKTEMPLLEIRHRPSHASYWQLTLGDISACTHAIQIVLIPDENRSIMQFP